MRALGVAAVAALCLVLGGCGGGSSSLTASASGAPAGGGSGNTTTLTLASLLTTADPAAAASAALAALPPLSASAPEYEASAPAPGSPGYAPVMAASQAQAQQQAFALAASATDPDPRWWSTQLTPAAPLMSPGQTLTVQVSKADINGTAYAAVPSGALAISVAWESLNGSIEGGVGQARWSGDGVLQVTAPAAQGPGRLLVALRPTATDPAVLADTQRWSALFEGEVWGRLPGVVDLTGAQVLFPLTSGSLSVSAQDFTLADIQSAAQAWSATSPTQLAYPLLVAGAPALQVGDAVDVRLQALPMGGVVQSVQTRGNEQLAMVSFDPGAVYQVAPVDQAALVAAGLAPQYPVWIMNATSLAASQLHAAGARPQALELSSDPVSFSCSPGLSVQLEFTPVFNFPQIGVYIQPSLNDSVSGSCTMTIDPGASLPIPSNGPLIALFGPKIAPHPYGEEKISATVQGSTPTSLLPTFGYVYGGSVLTRMTVRGPTSGALSGSPTNTSLQIDGELGIASEASVEAGASGGALGLLFSAASMAGLKAPAGALPSFTAKAYVWSGVGVSLPSASAAYQQNKSASVKLGGNAGVSFEVTGPSALLQFVSAAANGSVSTNDPTKITANVSVPLLARESQVGYQAQAQPQTSTSATISQLGSSSAAGLDLLAQLFGSSLPPISGEMAPQDQTLSFFQQSVKPGSTVSAKSSECDKQTQKAPIVAQVFGGLWGESNPVEICGPLNARIDATEASGQVGQTVHATVSGSVFDNENPLPPQKPTYNGSTNGVLSWSASGTVQGATTQISEQAQATCSGKGVFTGTNTLTVTGMDKPVTAPNILSCSDRPPEDGGDPHILLPGSAQQSYDFQATGDFTMLSNADGSMVVQARFDTVPGTDATAVSRLAAQVGSDVVEIGTDDWYPESGPMNNLIVTVDGKTLVHGNLALNDKITPFRSSNNAQGPVTSYALPGGGLLYAVSSGVYGADPDNAYPNQLLIIWPPSATPGAPVAGLFVGVNQLDYTKPRWLDFYPVLPASLAGQLGGLLGNGSGNGYASLVLPGGTPLLASASDPLTFVDIYGKLGPAWAVASGSCLFTGGCSAPQLPNLPVILTPAQQALGNQACTSAPAGYLHSACVFDVGLTGDTTLAQSGFYTTLPGVDASAPLPPESAPASAPAAPPIALTVSPGVLQAPAGNQASATLSLQADQAAGYLMTAQLPAGAVLTIDGQTLGTAGLSGSLAAAYPVTHALALQCSAAGTGALTIAPVDPLTQQLQLAGVQLVQLACTAARQYAAGLNDQLAIDSQGQLVAWGDNSRGQLGTGQIDIGHTATSVGYLGTSTPVAVAFPPIQLGSASIVDVVTNANGMTSFARDSAGRVWAWGDDSLGQVGDAGAGAPAVPTPTLVPFPSTLGSARIDAVAAGTDFALALDSSGRVWAWGNDLYGALGDGSGALRGPALVQFPSTLGSATIRSIWAGTDVALALDSQGRLWGWGDNSTGLISPTSLGAGLLPTLMSLPSAVAAVTDVAIASDGPGTASSVVMVLDAKGQVWAWGNGLNGLLGDGRSAATTTTISAAKQVAIAVPSGTHIVALAAGSPFAAFALDSRGVIWGWGNDCGLDMLGPNSCPVNPLTPQVVSFPASWNPAPVFSSVQVGDGVVMAMDNSHRLWVWGFNQGGDIGVPTPTLGLATTAPPFQPDLTPGSSTGAGGSAGPAS